MKFFCAVVALSVAACLGASEPQVVDRGPHHRTWVTTRQVATLDGKTRTETGSYVELQGGLHRWTEQGWVETSPRIEVFQDGAVARNLQYQAIFAPNLATPGAIDLRLPDGQRLQGHLLGLALTDGNKSVLIAEVKDCSGVIGGAEQNEVTFADAFTDFDVSVQFVLQRDRISQNVIVHQQLPHPSEWGLTENAMLEVLTEFVTFPVVRLEDREAVEGIAAQHVTFDSMEFVSGKAFSIGDEANATGVSKAWELFEGQRSFLVEKIPWKSIAPELAKLPPVAKGWKKKGGALMARNQLHLPRREQARAAVKPIQVAQASAPKRGYLIDWELVGSTNYFLWTNSATFYISGPFTVKTNVFEGGVVIKYAPANSAKLTITGPVTCLSSIYAPIILTARDDHSVGLAIGSASLSGKYANTALNLDYLAAGSTFDLQNLRISHADAGINFNAGRGHVIQNVQLIDCDKAINANNASYKLRNGLIQRATTALHSSSLSGTTSEVQQVTFRECTALWALTSSNITNSLLVAVTNIGAFAGAYNGTNSNPANVFQPVGAGYSYLTNNSPFRNAGTTNIDSTLLGALKQLTTYPPTIAGDVVTLGNTNLTLSAQASRDTDTPDLGYHYSPLDYAFGGAFVTNSTITLQPGTAIGLYSPTNGGSSYYGIGLADSSKLFSDGLATNLNRIVRYNMVQEQSTSTWNTTPNDHILTAWFSVGVAPEVRFTFTEWSSPAADAHHFFGGTGADFVAPFSHCQFIGGRFRSERPDVSITNCLFHRVATYMESADHAIDARFQNNTLYGGSLELYDFGGGTWALTNNLFHGTTVSQAGTITHDYNGYITNAAGQWLTGSGSANIWTNAFDYQTGALGRFYQPTSSRFLNAGNTTANLVGLYHFTCTTNNVKEANSVADIGFHYVATTNGVPIDTDLDGNPDYLEDANGNGLVGSGETHWDNPGDGGLRVLITQPKTGQILP